MVFVVFLVVIICVTVVITLAITNGNFANQEKAKLSVMTSREREDYLAKKKAVADLERNRVHERSDRWAFGQVNPAMVCPHCHTRGQIRTKIVEQKKGVSGARRQPQSSLAESPCLLRAYHARKKSPRLGAELARTSGHSEHPTRARELPLK